MLASEKQTHGGIERLLLVIDEQPGSRRSDVVAFSLFRRQALHVLGSRDDEALRSKDRVEEQVSGESNRLVVFGLFDPEADLQIFRDAATDSDAVADRIFVQLPNDIFKRKLGAVSSLDRQAEEGGSVDGQEALQMLGQTRGEQMKSDCKEVARDVCL